MIKLRSVWGVWLLHQKQNCCWEEDELVKFSTLKYREQLACLYVAIPFAIKCPTDLAVFRDGIFPDVKYSSNQFGGRWILSLEKCHCLEHYWGRTIIFILNERFQHSDQVCGAIVNTRGSYNIISLWIRNRQKEINIEIGYRFKEFIGYTHSIGYEPHSETTSKYHVIPNYLYSV